MALIVFGGRCNDLQAVPYGCLYIDALFVCCELIVCNPHKAIKGHGQHIEFKISIYVIIGRDLAPLLCVAILGLYDPIV